MYNNQEKLEFQKMKKEKDTYYSFFTSGLLYWVLHSINIIQDNCSRFFIAAGLTDEEKKCFADNIKAPVFFIENHCTDKDIWNLLFDTCDDNFGWIDIDCFINRKDIFNKMSDIEPDILFNSYWTGYKNTNIEFISTFFVFVNIKAVKNIRKRNIPITPYTYTYRKSDHNDSKIIPKELYPYITTHIPLYKYPCDDVGIDWPPFFDTLLLYQIVARQFGYKIANISKNICNNELNAFHIGQCIHYSYNDMQNGHNNNVAIEIKKHINKKGLKNINSNIISYDPANYWKSILVYFILIKYIKILPLEYTILKKYIIKQQSDHGLNACQFEDHLIELAKHDKFIESILQLVEIDIPSS